MVVAHEAGIAERIELVPTIVSAYRINDDILQHNPLGKIPTLVRDDGITLFDSRVTCEYLDGLRLAPQGRLFPVDETPRFEALGWQALGDGIVDLLLARLSEERTREPELRSDVLVQAITAKLTCALEVLEAQADALATAQFGIGHVAIGSALSYLDFRFAKDAWRKQRAQLASWHHGFEARPSVAATVHIDA
jgi:glutathione S-transferase